MISSNTLESGALVITLGTFEVTTNGHVQVVEENAASWPRYTFRFEEKGKDQMMRCPPGPLDGEAREEWERRALRPWRMEIKRSLLAERGWWCERCGDLSQVLDLDEGVVPRCDMGGLSLEKRARAFAEVNLFLLCPDCNREQAHDRDGAFRRACERYGEEMVRAWYQSLGLKAPRREWL